MFPIKKNFRGKYVFYDFTGQSKNVKEAERLMGIDDKVLRFLTVRIGENVDVDKRKAAIAKAEALAAQKQNELN